MALTKSEIDTKRATLIEKTKDQIAELRKILSDFGDIPGIADNVDANILINQILMTKQDCEKRLKAYQTQNDIFIEGFDMDCYINNAQDKISFYKSSYESYKFNASFRHPYCKARAPKKLKKVDIQALASNPTKTKKPKTIEEKDMSENQPGNC